MVVLMRPFILYHANADFPRLRRTLRDAFLQRLRTAARRAHQRNM